MSREELRKRNKYVDWTYKTARVPNPKPTTRGSGTIRVYEIFHKGKLVTKVNRVQDIRAAIANNKE